MGGLLSEYDYASAQSLLPVYDGNGNIHGLVNQTDGTLVAAYEYDAFGRTLRESGQFAASNPFRFSSKYTDTESSLVYYGHRYYSPSLGRFLNRDPKEEDGGMNLYGFCGNNGVNRWDYLGQKDMLETIAGWFGFGDRSAGDSSGSGGSNSNQKSSQANDDRYTTASGNHLYEVDLHDGTPKVQVFAKDDSTAVSMAKTLNSPGGLGFQSDNRNALNSEASPASPSLLNRGLSWLSNHPVLNLNFGINGTLGLDIASSQLGFLHSETNISLSVDLGHVLSNPLDSMTIALNLVASATREGGGGVAATVGAGLSGGLSDSLPTTMIANHLSGSPTLGNWETVNHSEIGGTILEGGTFDTTAGSVNVSRGLSYDVGLSVHTLSDPQTTSVTFAASAREIYNAARVSLYMAPKF